MNPTNPVTFKKSKGKDYQIVINVANPPQKKLFRQFSTLAEQPPKSCLKKEDDEKRALLEAVSENDIERCKTLLESVDLSEKNSYFFHPLLLAAQKGNCEIIKLFLEHKADINTTDNKNSSALHLALKQLHCKTALFLLENGILFKDLRDSSGNFAIHLAALEGKQVIEAVQWMLQNGQDPNVQNKKMQTPLHLAATKGHDEIMNLLLTNPENSAKWDVKAYFNRTPLHYAALNGHSVCCDILLRLNEDQTMTVDKEGNTPLILAATKGHSWCCSRLTSLTSAVIIKNSLDAKDGKGNTALHYAAKNGFISTVEILLNARADCSTSNNEGNTPIHTAASQKNTEVLKALIKRNPPVPGAVNKQKQGLLHIAAINSCEESLHYLLDLDSLLPTINTPDCYGQTPLHLASLHSSKESIKVLIAKGADCKPRDLDGNAPLHLAAGKGLTDICKLLLQDKGIQAINVKNKAGETPLHLAVKNGSLYCCKILIIKGALLTVKNGNGYSPYHVAAANGKLDILKFFTKTRGCIISEIVEGSGDTPLHLAAKNGHFDCCNFFLTHIQKNLILTSNERDDCALDEAFNNQYDEIFSLILSFCPPPKQNKWNHEFSATLHSYLHKAIFYERKMIQKAIVESWWWFSGFSSCYCRSGQCNNLQLLIETNPELAKAVFDKCIEDIDGDVVYDFRVFEQEFYIPIENVGDLRVASPFDMETGKLMQDRCHKFPPENGIRKSPLQAAIQTDCRDLIQHSLINEYWLYKWRTYLKNILYVMLVLEIFIVVILCLFMSQIWNVAQVNSKMLQKNATLDLFNLNCTDDLSDFLEVKKETWFILAVLRVLIVVMATIMFASEFHMIRKFNFSSYFTVGAVLRNCRLICVIFLLLPLTPCSYDVWITTTWQWLIGIIALLTSWFNMIHTLNLIPKFSVFMPITYKFIKSFCLVLMYIILILFIFAFIFYLLFNEHPAFINLGIAFIKSIVWILGDLAYDDMFLAEGKPLLYPAFSNIFFIVYVTSIGGFIVNLIITQPADHFDSFRNDAAWYEAASRVQLLLKFDQISSKLRRKYTIGFWVNNPKAEMSNLITKKLFGLQGVKKSPPKKGKFTSSSTEQEIKNRQFEILLAKIEELKSCISADKRDSSSF